MGHCRCFRGEGRGSRPRRLPSLQHLRLSTCIAEARVAPRTSESHPVLLCSRAATPPPYSTESLEQEWPSLRPAAKVQAGTCPSVDVAALAGDALINYLRTTSKDCLESTLSISSNPPIRADVPTIFSNRNIQSVFAEIEELAAGYDGTNSTGMLQLWFFVEVGYDYHRFFPGQTGVGPFDAATDRAFLAASDAFVASDHFYAPNDEAAQILYYYFTVCLLCRIAPESPSTDQTGFVRADP